MKDAEVTVTIPDERTSFQEGEIIPLVLSFTSPADKRYWADNRNYDRSGRLSIEAYCISKQMDESGDASRHLRAWYNGVVEVITKNRDILGGTPVFRGTRVPIQTLFDYLKGGDTLEEFLTGFPTVSRESAIAALEEAKELLLSRL